MYNLTSRPLSYTKLNCIDCGFVDLESRYKSLQAWQFPRTDDLKDSPKIIAIHIPCYLHLNRVRGPRIKCLAK